MAVDGASQESRDKIAEMLNKAVGEWKPEDVIANECLTLIRQNSLIPVNDVSISGTHELPEAEDLRVEEPNIFTAKIGGVGTTLQGKWMNAAFRWQKENGTIQYKKDYPNNNADWALETNFSYIRIEKGNKLEFGIVIKLVETSSGKTIATDASWVKIQITPINEVLKIKVFKEEFNESVNKLCSKILGDMGLISL